MKTKHIFILSSLLVSACALAFADQPTSSLDDKPSVDSAASSSSTNSVQAPALPPDATAADTHANYLYDLKKLIEKSRDNIKEVNEKIKEQAVLKRNQKREERAREYYEKGVELTNEGKLDEAREYFEKAIRITEHPEMAGYIRESQRRLRKQESALQAQENQHNHQIKEQEQTRKEDVEAAYREAVDLYKQKKYHPAQDAFEHVDQIAPDYRATDSYLKIIDQDIITSDALAAKQQAKEIERQQKEAELAREKEKEMWRQQIEEKEKERKEEITKQAEEVYEQAVDLYKKKSFAQSKKKFEEVSWVIPDYKATMKYLSRIDRDAKEEEQRVAEEQEKALQEQRWEEEVERKKQEAEKKQALEAQERQHKKDLQEQAQFLYKAAVTLFNHQQMDESLEKFNDIEKLYPDFKSTRIYIARIQQIKSDNLKKEAQLQEKAKQQAQQAAQQAQQNQQVQQVQQAQQAQQAQQVQQQSQPEQTSVQVISTNAQEVIPAEDLKQRELQLEKRRAQELKDRTNQAQQIYTQALSSYRAHHWELAHAQFSSVEELIPEYKHTRRYLEKTEEFLAEETKKKEAAAASVSAPAVHPAIIAVAPASPVVVTEVEKKVEVVPVQPQPVLTYEQQQRQAQEIADLAEKSAKLYRQIADIANDSTTVETKHKVYEVNEIINDLKESKERLLRQIQEEQKRREQEALRNREAQHRADIEKLYQEAQDDFRANQYAKAKIKFLELENVYPDYKSTRRYLSRIEQELKIANVEVVTNYEQIQALHLKQLEDKVKAQQEQQANEAQKKEQDLEQQQQASLKELAQKASDINEDIIRLSKSQDIDAMKAKFTDLENTVTALTNLKAQMDQQKELQRTNKKLAEVSIRERNRILRSQKIEYKQIQSYYQVTPLQEYRPVLSNQPNNLDHFRRKEIEDEQNKLYSEAVDRYEHQKYTQAKLLFGELAQQNDRRAEKWLKKVDHAITQQLLKSQAAEEHERTAFIEDQLKAQRQLRIIQERERQRQKQLSEELERQKRLYEDDRLLQLRKEETMKAQERERQLQEQKRLRIQEENQRKEENLRFHKIEIAAKPQAVVTSTAQAAVTAAAVVPAVSTVVSPVPAAVPAVVPAVSPAPAIPAGMNAEQMKAQEEFSNKRKAFLDDKYNKEQLEKARQHEKESREQHEKERLDQIKAKEEARERMREERRREKEEAQAQKAERAREKAEKRAQEKKEREEQARQDQERREERAKQEEVMRQEKIKEQEMMRQEEEHNKELERQEQERQATLEAQRESVRKQLEDGVEVIYQEAMNLYSQGNFSQAAERFKDVQDILPGYKRSGEYLNDSLEKSMAVKSTNSATPAVTNPDNVSKALDLFDSNVK